MLFKCLIAVIGFMTFQVFASEDLSFPVEKYYLDNGMTVLLHQDESLPLISYHTWMRVGSKDEERGYTGIAHLFEHLMFKGAKKYTNKDYERVLKEIGATNNAFTSRDYTGYYVNAPSKNLELVMDMESDRFQNLNLTEENLKSEREVVKEERRYRVENRVEGLVFEHINEISYDKHSYKWPVIGYIADLNNITLEKAKNFYKTYYSPNNAVLVIAGNFKIEQVKEWIQKYYGSFKEQKIQRPFYEMDLPQTQQKEDVFYKEIQSDYLTVSFVVPSVTSPEIHAIELLAEVLGKGESSRLYKKLVYEQQIATSVYSFVMSNLHSSVFQIHIKLKPYSSKKIADQIKNKALAVVWGELFQLRSFDVSNKEYLKGINTVIKSHVDTLKTLDGRAYALAMNETVLGDYKKLFDDLDQYKRVLPKDIRNVAGRYLKQSQSNIVLARPIQFK